MRISKRHLGIVLLVIAPASAQLPDTKKPSGEIVATVGQEPIFAEEVTRLVYRATAGREVNPITMPWLEAQVLSELVDRRLVLAYAQRTNSGVTPAEVDSAIEALQAKADSIDGELRRSVRWKLVWDRYLQRYLTDDRLRALFDAQRRQFDGTELAVSHILLQASDSSNDTPVDRATALRLQIISGEISFDDAAKKYSVGPSGRTGGQLGYTRRHGAMHEAFARASFELEVGQISRPIPTPFGLHLIRCDAIRPGTKRWDDVRRQLEEALAAELLEKLARLEERFTPVSFTGIGPHLQPGTRELVPARKNRGISP